MQCYTVDQVQYSLVDVQSKGLGVPTWKMWLDEDNDACLTAIFWDNPYKPV